MEINYKFCEDMLIDEFKRYIDSTYGGHYSKDKFQATEFIIDSGHGTGFCIGNVLKYAQRYGKKGSHADARKDLLKVLHYALIQLYIHDQQDKEIEDYIADLHDSDYTVDIAGATYDYAVSQDFDVEPRDINTITISGESKQ